MTTDTHPSSAQRTFHPRFDNNTVEFYNIRMTTGEIATPEHTQQPFTLEDRTFDALLTLHESGNPADGCTFDTGHSLYETLTLSTAPEGLRSRYILFVPRDDERTLMKVVVEHKLPSQVLSGDLKHFDVVASETGLHILEKQFTYDKRGVPTQRYVRDMPDEMLISIIEDAKSGRQTGPARTRRP